MTPGDDDDLPSIGNKCLELCKLLGNQGLAFSFNLTFGTFCFTLDTTGMRSLPAQVPVKKKKSPSAINRDKRRRIAFLRRKDAASSSGASLTVLDTLASSGKGNPSPLDTLGATATFESPQPSAHIMEPTQSFSKSLCSPSASESTHLDPNNHDGGHITKKMRMDKVPPLKVLVNAQSTPKYRIQQLDGNCSLSDISLCEDDQPSEHDDDSNMDQSISCPNCDQTLTSTFHQCQDSDHMCDNFCQHTSDQITQELITTFTFDPFMGPHNEKCDWQKEKGKNVHLRLIERYSSVEDKERERKYLNRKYCFCYDDKRLFDFKL